MERHMRHVGHMENLQLVVSNFTFAPDDQRRVEEALGADAFVMVQGGRDTLREALLAHPEADVVVSFFPPADLFSIAPNLKWIALPSAGADHAIRAGIVQQGGGPVVTTASGIHSA